MEVLKNCLKFEKTEDVPSKTCVSTSLEEILVRFLKVPYPSSRKENSFSLFSPKFLATKSEEFMRKVSLSLHSEVVFLDYTFLDTLRTLGRLGMRDIYVLHWGSLSFLSVPSLALSYFHLGALLICFYAHLAFILLDNIKTLRHLIPPSFLPVARIYHTK
jgi:hypothetical protein